MSARPRTRLLTSAAFALALLTGCGEPGAPLPPSLNLPQVVRDLSATRTGNTVHLAWTTTNRTTDRAQISGSIRTHICRVEGNGLCELVTDLPLKLGQSAQFDDTLPTDKLQGQPQLLTYYIELLNHARKSAGQSNPAYSASGQAVPEITALRVATRPEGVELHWDALHWPATRNTQPGTQTALPTAAQTSVPQTSVQRSVRLVRTLELQLKQPGTPVAAVMPSAGSTPSTITGKRPSILALGRSPEPLLQALEVPATDAGDQQGAALDRTIRFGETYRYRAQGVETLTLDGHTVTLVSHLSAPAVVSTKDVFPPAVPEQLAAAADPSSHAIDLSWSADSEPDLAGYVVYRREAAGTLPLVRISGPTLLMAPAFHDTDVKPGIAYAYSVSALDASGNESAHSAETTETLKLP